MATRQFESFGYEDRHNCHYGFFIRLIFRDDTERADLRDDLIVIEDPALAAKNLLVAPVG